MRQRLASLLLLAASLWAQANGRLQIHFIDAGQGDAALLISPLGETVLFDNGARGKCDKPRSYLSRLGVRRIDYQVVSHYHADHIGCTVEVLGRFPLQKQSLDRGESYDSRLFDDYLQTVGSKRRTARLGNTITLDAGSPNPVVLRVAGVNGADVETTNENDLSLVVKASFGGFDAVFGGDLSGFREGDYDDIETPIAPEVGQVEVYKVHHHGSKYSSNETWLKTIRPRVGVISAGEGNSYRHPTAECLRRLHQFGVKTYWTSEGNGADPDETFDVVGGDIVIDIGPGENDFTVTYDGGRDRYTNWGGSGGAPSAPSFKWSQRSPVYHFANCRYAAMITEENLRQSATPPPDKTLHVDCPK